MRFTLLTTTPVIARHAADTGSTGTPTQTGAVAEIVTFRLLAGFDPESFATAAQAMTPFLHNTGAVMSRTLSCDEDGLWTDHITWSSMQAAKSAAAKVMEQPEAGPFMAMIDPASVDLRHAPVRFSLDKD